MKRTLRALGCALCMVLLVGFLPGQASAAEEKPLTILFTHDTHDHFYLDAAGQGGHVRLATLLRQEREAAEGPVVTLDAGDFSMGSLFQTIYATDAPELRALGAMGYDVTTFGNHEFDYRQQGLAEMLTAAKNSGDPLPALVQCNYRTPLDQETGAALVQAMEDYPVTDYTVLERDGLRIAVFGVMGQDAHACAPMSGMAFEPMEEAAARVVAQIQEKEEADYIICLSHAGTVDGKGEDYELAQAVDGIDVILSGHTHTTLPDPIQVNDTILVSCGEYTRNLGRLVVEKSETGAVVLRDYDLLPVTDDLEEDEKMVEFAAEMQQKVNATYLSSYGMSYDQVLTYSQGDFTREGTGNLIGAAYRWAVRQAEGADSEPVDFAVAPHGVIRDCLRQGDITTAGAFDLLSLGSGADGTPAYPLVSVYLTGADLKNAAEVDASISGLMPAARLYGDGLYWVYNPHRMILDRVTDCCLTTPEGVVPLEPDRLYRVVADLYSGQMLGAVERQSFGLLTVTPRDRDGNPITNLEDHILHQQDGSELKAWYALASYLDAQEFVTPPEAEELAAHKLAVPSWAPSHLLFPAGAPTLVVLGVLVLLMALVVLTVVLVRRRRQRSK